MDLTGDTTTRSKISIPPVNRPRIPLKSVIVRPPVPIIKTPVIVTARPPVPIIKPPAIVTARPPIKPPITPKTKITLPPKPPITPKSKITLPIKPPVTPKPKITLPPKPPITSKPKITLPIKPPIIPKPKITLPIKPPITSKPKITLPPKPPITSKPKITLPPKPPSVVNKPITPKPPSVVVKVSSPKIAVKPPITTTVVPKKIVGNAHIIPYPHDGQDLQIVNKPVITIGQEVSYKLTKYKKTEIIHGTVTKLNKKTVGVSTANGVKLVPYDKIIQPKNRALDENITERFIDPMFPDEIKPTFTYPVIGKYSNKFVKYYRTKIYESLQKKYYRANDRDAELPDDLLVDMWSLYDKYFFKGHLTEILRSTDTQLQIGFSDKPSSTVSYCTLDGCVYKILINANIINSLFRSYDIQHYNVGFLTCNNKIVCCMLEVEHALIRYIISANPEYDASNPLYDMNGIWFAQLLMAYFNNVYIPDNVLSSGYKSTDFAIGQIVKYQYSLVDTAYGKITELTSVYVVVNNTTLTVNVIYPISTEERLEYERYADANGFYVKSAETNIVEKPYVSTEDRAILYNIPEIGYPVRTRYSTEFITHHRKLIYDEIKAKYGHQEFVTEEMIEDMFYLYDRYFFNYFLTDTFKDLGWNFIIVLETSPNREFANLMYTHNSILLYVNKRFYNRLDSKIRAISNAKPITCNEILECLQITVEHETCHILQYISENGIISEDSIFGDHGQYFMRLVYAYFGQTESVGNQVHDNRIIIIYNIGDYVYHPMTIGGIRYTLVSKIVDIVDDLCYLDSGFTIKAELLNPANPKVAEKLRNDRYYLYDSRLKNIEISYEPLPRFTYPMTMGYSQKFINYYLDKIVTIVLNKHGVNNNHIENIQITDKLLEDLYILIDLYFFKGYIFLNRGPNFKFNIVRDSESNIIASCTRVKCDYTVTISTTVLEALANDINQHPEKLHQVDGVSCSNLVSCTMILLIDSVLDLLIYTIETTEVIPTIANYKDDFKQQLRQAFFRL